MPDSTAARFCPRCDLPNQCTVAAGADPAHCWCQQVDFRAIELPADRSRCLCAQCVTSMRLDTGHASHAR